MINIKKISIKIIGPYLYFDYTYARNNSKLFNTNIISDQELIFNEEYIKNNHNIVAAFLEEMTLEKNLTKIRIKSQNIGLIILDLFKQNKNIKEIYIEDENPITFDLYLKIINCQNIKNVNCYSIPKFIIEQFDKKNIKVTARDEIFFTSHFMQVNNLINYTNIYYKNNIIIDRALDENDITDLNTFCSINKHLKEIH